jgi:DNA-binding IclR family transcriptional regulator
VYSAFGERDRQLGGISAPVLDSRGRLVGALTISFPLSRLDRDAAVRLEPLVVSYAAQITAQLGGSRLVQPRAA